MLYAEHEQEEGRLAPKDIDLKNVLVMRNKNE